MAIKETDEKTALSKRARALAAKAALGGNPKQGRGGVGRTITPFQYTPTQSRLARERSIPEPTVAPTPSQVQAPSLGGPAVSDTGQAAQRSTAAAGSAGATLGDSSGTGINTQAPVSTAYVRPPSGNPAPLTPAERRDVTNTRPTGFGPTYTADGPTYDNVSHPADARSRLAGSVNVVEGRDPFQQLAALRSLRGPSSGVGAPQGPSQYRQELDARNQQVSLNSRYDDIDRAVRRGVMTQKSAEAAKANIYQTYVNAPRKIAEAERSNRAREVATANIAGSKLGQSQAEAAAKQQENLFRRGLDTAKFRETQNKNNIDAQFKGFNAQLGLAKLDRAERAFGETKAQNRINNRLKELGFFENTRHNTQGDIISREGADLKQVQELRKIRESVQNGTLTAEDAALLSTYNKAADPEMFYRQMPEARDYVNIRMAELPPEQRTPETQKALIASYINSRIK